MQLIKNYTSKYMKFTSNKTIIHEMLKVESMANNHFKF